MKLIILFTVCYATLATAQVSHPTPNDRFFAGMKAFLAKRNHPALNAHKDSTSSVASLYAAYQASKAAQATTSIPERFELQQNYPNPFNPSTNVGFRIANAGFVSLKVYDVLGREVATLVDGQMEAGYHTATFDASHLSSGLYFARLSVTPANGSSAEVPQGGTQAQKPRQTTGGQAFVQTVKMLLVK